MAKRMAKNTTDVSVLQMALVGFEIEREKIAQKIAEIRAQLGRKGPAKAGGRRNLSPAARERIAAAQRKRWAEHRKKAAQAAKAEK